MKRYLFLDIDGVLNSPATWGRRPAEKAIDADKVARLDALVQKHDLHIVISSSWKHIYPIEDLRLMLNLRGLRDAVRRVVSMTPHAHEFDHEFRGSEVSTWLRMNAPDAPFVILDDLGLTSFEGLGRHLVQTDGSVGLTDWDCEMAEMCLERQSRSDG